jgi:hypothetical protein
MPISNLKKQKCYIEVDVKEDNPIVDGAYTVLTQYSETHSVREFVNGAFVNYDGYAVTHWLHPLENRYILTEEELYEIIRPLDLLVQLREYKEAFDKDAYYLKMQPQAWERARKLMQEYTKHIESLNI